MDHPEHASAVAPVALAIVALLSAALIGGELSTRLRQPAVLGELFAGIALGHLPIDATRALRDDPIVEVLAELGVLLLLFEVGLESTVRQMLEVGRSALMVALLGAAAPFSLGWVVGAWLLPDASVYTHAFLGATLSATSIGITARVLKDLGQTKARVSRVILGAAMLDDVIGLVILTVASGATFAADRGESVSPLAVVIVLAKASLFLVGSMLVGRALAPNIFSLATRLRNRGALLALGLLFCFSFAWLANAIGLAPLVGAFAAGLVLESADYRGFIDRGERPLEELIDPITRFLAPIFFVLMGLRTDLRAFGDLHVVLLAFVLTVVAILGKLLCGLGADRSVDRLAVGIGMIPRGEVGLIFASTGAALSVAGAPVLGRAPFSAIVMMVIVTTMVTPPLLERRLARAR